MNYEKEPVKFAKTEALSSSVSLNTSESNSLMGRIKNSFKRHELTLISEDQEIDDVPEQERFRGD